MCFDVVLPLFCRSFVVANFGGSEAAIYRARIQSKVCVIQNGYWKFTGSYTNIRRYDVVEVKS